MLAGRLFIAFPPEPDWLDANKQIFSSVRRAHIEAGFKPVREENYHATLVFIGSILPDGLLEIQRRVEQLTGGFIQGQASFLKWSGFPSDENATVAVAEFDGTLLSERIASMQHALMPFLSGTVFPRFRMHLTIARRRVPAPIWAQVDEHSLSAFVFKKMVLLESRATDAGVRYIPLHSWNLTEHV